MPHNMEVDMAVEVVHPSSSYIFPARVSVVIDPYYYMVEMINVSPQSTLSKFTVCCRSGSPYVLPAGWCYRHSIKLQTSAGQSYTCYQIDSSLVLPSPTPLPSLTVSHPASLRPLPIHPSHN